MTTIEVADEDLTSLGVGLLLGLVVSVTINLLSDTYQGIQFLSPAGKTVFEPVVMLYIAAIVIGMSFFISPCFVNSQNFRKISNFISGLLIMMGLTMLGTIL